MSDTLHVLAALSRGKGKCNGWEAFRVGLDMAVSYSSVPISYIRKILHKCLNINPLNADLNPICHLLALLGARHILHVSRIRVNAYSTRNLQPG